MIAILPHRQIHIALALLALTVGGAPAIAMPAPPGGLESPAPGLPAAGIKRPARPVALAVLLEAAGPPAGSCIVGDSASAEESTDESGSIGSDVEHPPHVASPGCGRMVVAVSILTHGPADISKLLPARAPPA